MINTFLWFMMQFTFLLLAIWSVLGQSPTEWILAYESATVQSVFRVMTSSRTWGEAEEFCATFPGGHLASIPSSWVNNVISGIAGSSRYNSNPTPDYIWIGFAQNFGAGAANLANEPAGEWSWADGSPITYLNWWYYGPQPDNFEGRQHCTRLLFGTWEDDYCWHPVWSICGIPACPLGTYLNEETKNPPGAISQYHIECYTCPPGKFANKVHPTSCTECEPGYVSTEGSTDCFACQPGKYAQLSSCELCPDGMGSTAGSSECNLICAAGEYSFLGSSCQKCPSGRYSTSAMSSSCESCTLSTPQLNSTFLRSGTTSESDCQNCIDGYYFSSSSENCEECPYGRFRDETMSRTQCQICPRGTYGNSSAASSCSPCPKGTWSNAYGVTSGSLCVQCDLSSEGVECPEGSPVPYVHKGFYRSLEDPAKVFQCVPSSACLEGGFGQTSCAEGYFGELCSQCIRYKYYRKDRECLKCSLSVLKWIVFISLILIGLSVLIFITLTSDKFASRLRVFMTGLQILAICPRLSENWPQNLVFVLRIFSLANLDLQIFSFDCQFIVDFWTSWILKLLSPFIIFSGLALLFWVLRLLQLKKHMVEGLSSRYVYIVVSIFQFLYLYILVTCLEPWQCLRQPDGSSTMISNPSIQCFDGSWMQKMKFFGIPILIFYVVLVPSFFVYIFFRNRHVISSTSFRSRFGSLTRSYREEYFWYEGVVTLKKICIVLLPDLFSIFLSQDVRILICSTSLMAFMFLDGAITPYRDRFSNQRNFVWSAVTIFLLTIAMIESNSTSQEAALSWISIFLVGSVTVTNLWMFFFHNICRRANRGVQRKDTGFSSFSG